MKKYIIRFFLLAIATCISVDTYSQKSEEESVKEFAAGKRTKFSSNGEGKSKGLKVHMKYPKSWTSIEGDRPHIVRKFVQPDNYALALIFIQKAEKEFTQAEIDEVMTKEGLLSFVPKNGTLISSNPNLKIDLLKAGCVEYTMTTERVDKKVFMHALSYVVVYKDYILSIQFMVGDLNGFYATKDTEATVAKKYKILYPMFWEMFNSLVIDNLYEK